MIADLKPYPTMKESGVEWLREVPSHWTLLPGRACYRKKKVPNKGLMETTVLSLSYGHIVVKPPEKLHGLVPASFETYQIVEPGDIIVRPTDLQNDWNSLRFGLSRDRGVITSAYMCLCTEEVVTRSYGHLLLHTYDLKKVFYGLGSGLRQNLDWFDFKYLPCIVPPLSEQSAIVRYLDHADRRIRRYIRAKQKLIKLLKEQKQAIIHQAVTGQVDVRTGRPYPAYKPSGVEWLGDVPENWEKRRLKSISRIRYGLGQPPRELSDGLPLIRATNVDHGRIVEKDLVYVDALDVPKSRDAFLSKKEIIVVRSGAYTADSAIIPEAYEGAVAGYDMIVTVSGAQPEFIAIALLSNYVRDDQLIISSTRSAQPHINAEELGTAVLLLPPLDEQAAIVRYLDKATADIDIATDRARRQIDLLKEYRTRLIADVVTGKLDVREAATGLPEVDLLADEFDVLTEAPETGMMELEDANETPEELAMESEVTV